MDAPVESSSPQGPLISPTPSSGPRRERHSESAGLSGVTLSTPSAAVAPPLAVALLELPPPAPPAPPPLAAAPRRSVPPPVDISSRPFGRRDPLYAHRYTARPRGRTAANSATAPGVDASEPLMRGRSATCSSEGHLCFRCGGPPLASPVPRSRAHDTRRRTRTSLPNAPFERRHGASQRCVPRRGSAPRDGGRFRLLGFTRSGGCPQGCRCRGVARRARALLRS